jgi:lambda family phage portal protein
LIIPSLKLGPLKTPAITLGRAPSGPPTIDVTGLGSFSAALQQSAAADMSYFDGDKFYGGFGTTQVYLTDYYTLRLRSNQLFNDNLYARGLIRRLITNEINTGLSLEAMPGELTGMDDKQRNTWSENVESRFLLWAKNPQLCDYKEKSTFGALQRYIRQEALVGGDVLVVLRISKVTGLPQVEVIPGGSVQDPGPVKPRQGNKITHGVETDSRGRQVAFYVTQEDGTSKRVPAFGERSGRKVAWLVYGTDKRVDELRGQPMLALILQSLREIDRYRDASLRKAVINSMLAMFIKKTEDKQGTRPVTGGAVRKDSTTVTNSDGTARKFSIAQQMPGTVMEELQQGEEPVAFNSNTVDINFHGFEAAILAGVAWSNEIPPSTLILSFSSNYAASQGEKNEFKMYLDKSRSERAEELDEPVYQSVLLSEVLTGKISAPGLLEARRDPRKYDIVASWIASDWSGAIKPNADLRKEVAGYKALIDEGLITRSRAARELTGMKFSQVAKQLKEENKAMAEATEPILELAAKFNVPAETALTALAGVTMEAVEDKVLELIEDQGGAHGKDS